MGCVLIVGMAIRCAKTGRAGQFIRQLFGFMDQDWQMLGADPAGIILVA